MRQLCVHRDMKHLGSLESTQEARVILLSCSPNFPRASYLDEGTMTHESIVKLQMDKVTTLHWRIQSRSQGLSSSRSLKRDWGREDERPWARNCDVPNKKIKAQYFKY